MREGLGVVLLLLLAEADRYDDNKTGRGNDNFYCNRQCRWYHGFFERSLQGIKQDNGTLLHPAPYCSCNNNGTDVGTAPYYTTEYPVQGPPTVPNGLGIGYVQCCNQGDDIPWGQCTEPTGHCHANTYQWAKPFDQDYWADQYSTPWLCVRNTSVSAPPFNMRESEAMQEACRKDDDTAADAACRAGQAQLESQGVHILHCGKCSSCSTIHDLEVLYKTRSNITTLMTQCSTSWVLSQYVPGGAQPLKELKQCLIGKGIDFSDDGSAWEDPANKPTCMDTWTDNILNDAKLCTKFCLTKFIKTKNTGNFAKDQCLQCDEFQSGPAFIKGAGANRRSSGIVSDIDRSQLRGTPWEQRICKVGQYSQLY